MKFSISKADITPQTPVYLAGFAHRTHESEGIHDPLYAKTVLLQANKTLLIVTLDLVGGDRSFIDAIKNMLEETFGLKHDEVLINFSHTHHAVAARGPGETKSVGKSSIMDYAFIRDTLVGLVSQCYANLTDGELLIARGTSKFGVSRRKLSENGVLWKPFYEAEIDNDLFVLKLVDGANNIKGILYSYGCHPTSMGPDNYLISNDYPGKTNQVLEETYPGATAVFLIGCAGEIKPLKAAVNDDFINCTIAQMEEAGVDLANDIISVLEKQSFSAIQGPFKTILVDATLHMERFTVEYYEEIVNDPAMNEVRKGWARNKIQMIKDGLTKNRLPLYISVWHLDDETRLIALEGEISTEYSLLIKKLFPGGKTIVLAYTNGVTFYVPTRKMLGEGGYEADFHHHVSAMSGVFLPEIEDIIIGRITKADLEIRLAGAS